MMLPVLPSYGLGATLNFIIQPATIATAHNVTLLTPPLGKWRFVGTKNAFRLHANQSREEYTFERFLLPFSTCDERAIRGRVDQPQQSTVLDGPHSEACGEKGANATLCRCAGYNQIKFLRDPMVSVDDKWLRNLYMNSATGEWSAPMYMSAVHVPLVQKLGNRWRNTVYSMPKILSNIFQRDSRSMDLCGSHHMYIPHFYGRIRRV